jgi:branched-chain amino acid transport system permease protein
MSFLIGVGVLVGIYALSGLVGAGVHRRLGVISIAHALVLGSGAYAFAQAAANGSSVPISILAGTMSGILAGMLVTVCSVRLSNDAFALFSFALQVAWTGVVSNTRDITGGALGLGRIPNLPYSESLGVPLATLLWVCAVLVLMGLLLARVDRSPFSIGCSVVARSDELALTLGASPRTIRLQVGAVYGLGLGLAGTALAGYVGFIDPSLFLVGTSVTILAIGLFAGSRPLLAVILGASLFVGLPELVRILGVPPSRSGYLQLMISGIAVVLASIAYKITPDQK